MTWIIKVSNKNVYPLLASSNKKKAGYVISATNSLSLAYPRTASHFRDIDHQTK